MPGRFHPDRFAVDMQHAPPHPDPLPGKAHDPLDVGYAGPGMREHDDVSALRQAGEHPAGEGA